MEVSGVQFTEPGFARSAARHLRCAEETDKSRSGKQVGEAGWKKAEFSLDRNHPLNLTTIWPCVFHHVTPLILFSHIYLNIPKIIWIILSHVKIIAIYINN